ncbi:Multidrug/Oligosaccharidyl-lipid/Polysaccharide (MOP) Flippase Superfamily [Achlya hypogyna]|uniref:Multidrug/Oligosaccharidyl-lipid/Polysaccharide (MOP) Flippase Superfamily n=1 Tax=Achlya hypogyna TaxID=1202772 RepID=A0A1V9YLM5_ACHHY|nr:Multidrug/Oligosaccharidyl-lipid/Polysaccharide (MOP) Flippase Superfamily [Achlya hypogyna]
MWFLAGLFKDVKIRSLEEAAPLLRGKAPKGPLPPAWVDEIQSLMVLSLPLVLSSALDHISGVVPVMMMGHLSLELSKMYISAIAMGTTFLLLTSWTMIWGNGAAMDTLCSQSYGAGQSKDMGLVFQAGLISGMILLIPMLALGFFAEDCLLLLGQSDEVAELASNLVTIMLPALPACLFYDLLRRVLQGQNVVAPLTVVSFVCVPLNLVINYALMFHSSLGYLGRAVAASIMALVSPVLLVPYIMRTSMYQTEWKGWNLIEAMGLVPEVLRLGVSGAAMHAFELWGIALTSIIAGNLPHGETAISADACMHSLRGFFYMVYGPIGVAGSIRVGNALGANDPVRAKVVAWQTVGICGALGLVAAFVMVWLRLTYPYTYTNDLAVVYLTSQLLLACAPFQMACGVYAAINGIFRGTGQQMRGAVLNGVAYIGIGLPLGVALAYVNANGIVGLWVGMSVAFLCCAVYGVVWLCFVDWDALAADAQVRTHDKLHPVHEPLVDLA